MKKYVFFSLFFVCRVYASDGSFDIDSFKKDIFAEDRQSSKRDITDAQRAEEERQKRLSRQASQESIFSQDSQGLSSQDSSRSGSPVSGRETPHESFADQEKGISIQKDAQYEIPDAMKDLQKHQQQYGEFHHPAQELAHEKLKKIDAMRNNIADEFNHYRSQKYDIEQSLTDQDLDQRIQKIKSDHSDFADLDKTKQMQIVYEIENQLQLQEKESLSQISVVPDSNTSLHDQALENKQYTVPSDIDPAQREKMQQDLKALEDKDIIHSMKTATLWKTTHVFTQVLDVSPENIQKVSREQQQIYNNLKSYLDQGGDPNVVWVEIDKRNSLINQAIELGDKEVLILLIDHGAKLDEKSLDRSLSQYNNLSRSSIQYKDGRQTITLSQDFIQASKNVLNTLWKFIDRLGQGWKNISNKSFMGKLFSLPQILATPTAQERALEEYHNQLLSRADMVFEIYARGLKVEHEDQQQAIKALESEYASLWKRISNSARRAFNAPKP